MAARKRLDPEPFELRIDGLDADGFGLATHAGRQLRVVAALPGERVLARHLFGRRFKGQAEVLEVLEPAAERMLPPCPWYGTCSACSLQHMAAPAQLAFKQDLLLTCLAEAGVPAPGRLLPPLATTAWGYRRRARLSVKDVPAKGKVLVGFRERDGRFVTDMDSCLTLQPRVAGRIGELAKLIARLDARASIPQIEACCGDSDAALVFRHLEPIGTGDREALTRFAADTGLAVWLQPGGLETVEHLAGARELGYAIPAEGLQMQFRPLDFVQVNGELNLAMIEQALELLAPESSHQVLDLFCGMGNFTLPLARHCAAVTGLEGDAALVARAVANAARNSIHNVEFMALDLYGPAATLPPGYCDRILLDPPRSGVGPLLPVLGAHGAERLLYVSCNPRTLAQDAAQLVDRHGYVLRAAGIMDMFPQTTHLESMALFELR